MRCPVAYLGVVLTHCLLAQEFTSGLQLPQRLLFTPRGNLLVSEGGTPQPNTGRVSVVDRQGNRRTLLSQLPTGLAHATNPIGPTGMALDGRTLYLLIGEGDIFLDRLPASYDFNPDGPSSPIFSSLLRIQFNRDIDDIQGEFAISAVDQWALIDGYDVNLRGQAGEQATVQLLTAFRQVHRNVLGGILRVRPSNPYAIVFDPAGRTLYVNDASAETISRIDPTTGRLLTLFRFEPFIRSTPAGPTYVDTVPTGMCLSGGNLVIGNLTGGLFPEGEAALRLFNPNSRRMQMMAENFTMVSDIACSGAGPGSSKIAVAEFSLNLAAGAPTGRVRLYDSGTNTTRILGSGFAPTGLAIEPASGDVYVALFGGRILRFAAQ
jgi:hypothetical protein